MNDLMIQGPPVELFRAPFALSLSKGDCEAAPNCELEGAGFDKLSPNGTEVRP